MKLLQDFNAFLADKVNLDSIRTERRESRIEALSECCELLCAIFGRGTACD